MSNKANQDALELVASKKQDDIKKMFDDIAPRYDFLNHVLSLGIDIYWRRTVANMVREHLRNQNKPASEAALLDLATGTGDFIIALKQKLPEAHITGADISKRMLEIASTKTNTLGHVLLKETSAEALPFENQSFDAITVGFGVRNFQDLDKGIAECFRVTKQGGAIFILEPMIPQIAVVRFVYAIYFKKILPFIGRLVSKSSFAYTYFSTSVEKFKQGGAFLEVLRKAGYEHVGYKRKTFQTAAIYYGTKR